jgi:nitric oxide reductase subunit C
MTCRVNYAVALSSTEIAGSRENMRGRLGLALIVVFLIVACGAENADKLEPTEKAAPVGDAVGDSARGEELFNQTVIGSQPGCITCHSLAPDKVLVGPSLAGIADRAAMRVSGQSAEQYLRESIANTDGFVVDGFPKGVMPAALNDHLSDQQLADLVAYLLTLN